MGVRVAASQRVRSQEERLRGDGGIMIVRRGHGLVHG